MSTESKNTPMIEQYLSIKNKHKDVLLFYRMGDFYELFFEDAIIASKALDITLTKRGKTNGQNIPMCGVPFHAADNYLPRLIKKGFNVAVCEQTETPEQAKARGTKGPLKREVVRIISPGTITEDNLLESNANNFLGAIYKSKDVISLSWVDVSTSCFKTRDFYVKNNNIKNIQILNNFLLRMNFSELLVSDLIELDFIADEWHPLIKRQPSNVFHYSSCVNQICSYYSINTLDGIGIFSEGEIIAAGVILSYLNLTQCGKIPLLSIMKSETESSFLEIDYFTQKSLELIQNLSGDSKGSLISSLDDTLTASGARLLKQRILEPFYNIKDITDKYDLIEWFIDNPNANLKYANSLKRIPDLERSLSRLSSLRGGPKDLLTLSNGFSHIKEIYKDLITLNKDTKIPSLLIKIIKSLEIDYCLFLNIKDITDKYDLIEWFIDNPNANLKYLNSLKRIPDLERSLSRLSSLRGGPKDLLTLSNGFSHINEIYKDLTTLNKDIKIPSLLIKIIKTLEIDYCLFLDIQNALSDEVPLLAKEGGFIKNNYNKKLDQLRDLRDNEFSQIVQLQKKYSEVSKVNSLKIKHNKVLGYHIEVRAIHDLSLRNLDQFIHRQTTAQTSRFTTIEMNDIENEIQNSSFESIKIELELFNIFVEQIVSIGNQVLKIASSISELDISIMGANHAKARNYVRPTISNTKILEIIEGRHPVVENQMMFSENSFISNDCILNKNDYIWLITGPNMAGKSTYLRQNALIVIMAQAGLYVPAKKANIGIFDKIFSRVGASDDLAKGQSTFMIEMIETSAILNTSTDKSLVILDEIGRGTATFDGLAIAWSVLDYLHNKIKPRTLFATHYHELTSLKESLTNLSCHKMVIKEWNDTIIFMHKINKGEADKSYGIHVAKLAGLPIEVVQTAKKILTQLEGNNSNNNIEIIDNTSKNLFSDNNNQIFFEEFDKLDADQINPREALNIIYKMKSIRNSDDF